MAAVKIDRDVHFAASAIWPVISDVVAFGDMSPDLLRCDSVEGKGVGMRRVCHDRHHHRWTEVCTEWDEGTGHTMQVESGDYPYPFKNMKTRLWFTPEGDGAVIHLRFDYQPKYGPIGLLLNKFWRFRYLEPMGDTLLDQIIHRARDRVWMYTKTVDDILTDKGRTLVSVTPQTTILQTAALLAEKRIGAAVVLQGDKLAGIVSERDIVHALPNAGAQIVHQPVSQIMTRRVILCAPDDDMVSVMACMTEKRTRHLPVSDGTRLLGMISIGDVIKARMADMEAESESMREYIEGRAWHEHYIHGAASIENPHF